MRAIIQRVVSASVAIGGTVVGEIGPGLVVLIGIGEGDGEEDVAWMAGKVARLRVFAYDAGLMNRSVVEVVGGILAISQFTLFASTVKGNRPSYLAAARPEVAEPLYRRVVAALDKELGRTVATGVFGADMQVTLVNDGPVSVIIDSRRRE